MLSLRYRSGDQPEPAIRRGSRAIYGLPNWNDASMGDASGVTIDAAVRV